MDNSTAHTSVDGLTVLEFPTAHKPSLWELSRAQAMLRLGLSWTIGLDGRFRPSAAPLRVPRTYPHPISL